jgi:hypothetical protein
VSQEGMSEHHALQGSNVDRLRAAPMRGSARSRVRTPTLRVSGRRDRSICASRPPLTRHPGVPAAWPVHSGRWAKMTRTAVCLVNAALAALCVACGSGSHPRPTSLTSSSTAHLQTSSHTAGRRRRAVGTSDWLGLNYNSTTDIRGLEDFSRLGIVYDRLGALEADAGWTIANTRTLANGLRMAVGAGMVPDVLIDPVIASHGCTTNPAPEALCLPVTPVQIKTYVSGFVNTATSILAVYPHSGVAFEPLNEPWDWAFPPDTPSGRSAARQYAALLASLLPAVKRAGVPLSTVYVPFTGSLADGTSWIPDLYEAEPCLRPGSNTCGPIEGWNAHPYGLPSGDARGISSLPGARTRMQSGENNIIISELGFCSTQVDNGQECDLNVPQVDGTNAQTSQWLARTLNEAAQMRRAGWLRALILWVRSGGGWSMQLTDGQLTPLGKVLTRFAARQQAGK